MRASLACAHETSALENIYFQGVIDYFCFEKNSAARASVSSELCSCTC